MMPDEKKCFVVMPVTTPSPMIDKYRDGREHFSHVYDCFFEPSIKEAGYTAIPPRAEGSDLIHAGIIQNLESADLVLCDMSCLNPNVFFEFGIRTALNKPICVVKDELTEDVPFDTTILNYHCYHSSLGAWDIQAERTRLVNHLRASATRSQGENTLWKFFGLRSSGRPYEVHEGSDAKIDYLIMQMESINQRVNTLAIAPSPSHEPAYYPRKRDLQSSYDYADSLVKRFPGVIAYVAGSGSDQFLYIDVPKEWDGAVARQVLDTTRREYDSLPVRVGAVCASYLSEGN